MTGLLLTAADSMPAAELHVIQALKSLHDIPQITEMDFCFTHASDSYQISEELAVSCFLGY